MIILGFKMTGVDFFKYFSIFSLDLNKRLFDNVDVKKNQTNV